MVMGIQQMQDNRNSPLPNENWPCWTKCPPTQDQPSREPQLQPMQHPRDNWTLFTKLPEIPLEQKKAVPITNQMWSPTDTKKSPGRWRLSRIHPVQNSISHGTIFKRDWPSSWFKYSLITLQLHIELLVSHTATCCHSRNWYRRAPPHYYPLMLLE